MGRLNCSPDEAFARLTSISRQTSTKVPVRDQRGGSRSQTVTSCAASARPPSKVRYGPAGPRW
ncbi:ANTAR domain-containing protein [Micromonospora sp. D93]|nr:ANTAR domain-containing protein [Micromonospora sp. D93]